MPTVQTDSIFIGYKVVSFLKVDGLKSELNKINGLRISSYQPWLFRRYFLNNIWRHYKYSIFYIGMETIPGLISLYNPAATGGFQKPCRIRNPA